MSVPTLKKNYFLVVAHDQPDAEARRTKHAQEHMAYNQPLIENGTLVVGGGVLPDGVQSSDAHVLAKVRGSYLIIQADTAEHVWDSLKKDAFYSSGEVWDHGRITVTPVFPAFPQVE
ncbi:hypothetical protein GSI_04961 [Ganoderma sinense ZZ0214-1]|uniref:YCII-related domain-containing protein n=1 Tax=Ganoderma sinense ZZ0214-1 TaxID=1077348 RepID=A0A2G8SGE6_9APHY|nr:hypothetical protein GSI_04961 [Ganoderma sinense ZZ0214-1]